MGSGRSLRPISPLRWVKPIPPANGYAVQEGRTFGMGASMTMFFMAMQPGNGVRPFVLGSMADRLGLHSAFYAAAPCMAAKRLIGENIRGSHNKRLR